VENCIQTAETHAVRTDFKAFHFEAEIVRALYRASQAGVPMELVVRGMCELRPGVRGVSETIRVRSIVGRFLEHSRFFEFANGGKREVYMGSADWMGRNLDHRVETTVPVLDAQIQARVCSILDELLEDNERTRFLQSDGTYVRAKPAPGEPERNAQEEFLILAEAQTGTS